MHPDDEHLLRLILLEYQAVESLRPLVENHKARGDWSQHVYRRALLATLDAGIGVQVGRAWFGSLAAHRKARQRALERCEEAGLLDRWGEHGGRPTHVALTPEGMEIAKRLQGNVTDPNSYPNPQLVAYPASESPAAKNLFPRGDAAWGIEP